MKILMPDNKQRAKCIKKFLHYFPKGFNDKKYISWERGYKQAAHEAWQEKLNETAYKSLLEDKAYPEIVKRVLSTEAKTNLLFSFEKMALRDGVKGDHPAAVFAKGLYDYIYGKGELQQKFEAYVQMLSSLPKKQTRVVTWPVLTVFGFIADPAQHIYLKPTVTKKAAAKYDYDMKYSSKPAWETYENVLQFAALLARDLISLQPKDMIDIQSFIWVLGSEEYPD